MALIALVVSVLAIGTLRASTGLAQKRHPPSTRRAEARPPVRRSAVVFVGGYFYDPLFGPYPWWPRPPYPYTYCPVYDNRAVLRVLATQENAAAPDRGRQRGIPSVLERYPGRDGETVPLNVSLMREQP
jgi:hypothetical protein